jgi:hypothetical protein
MKLADIEAGTYHKSLVERLNNDEVVTLESAKENNELLEFMLENDIDPDDFRTNGKAIWLA